jgi:hypothetical protein
MKKPEFLSALLRKFPLLENRYFLSFIAFLIWVVFIDASSLISQYSGNQELFEIEAREALLSKRNPKNKSRITRLVFRRTID